MSEPITKRAFITSIQHWSLHDGPGLRTTIYFKGCPLDCWWCHNPETISNKPETMYYASTKSSEVVGREVDVAEVMKEIEADKIFYDDSGGGVTFSGGEPLQQFDFVKIMASQCKEASIHTALDTSLFAENGRIKSMMEVIDLFLIDVKLINQEKHKKYTGVNNSLILDNVRFLTENRVPVILRTPLIHGINDSEKDLSDFKDFLTSITPYNGLKLEVLPYHKFGEGKYEALGRPYRVKSGEVPQKTVDLFLNTFKSTGHNVRINTW